MTVLLTPHLKDIFMLTTMVNWSYINPKLVFRMIKISAGSKPYRQAIILPRNYTFVVDMASYARSSLEYSTVEYDSSWPQ
jgi:hypothetical protein